MIFVKCVKLDHRNAFSDSEFIAAADTGFPDKQLIQTTIGMLVQIQSISCEMATKPIVLPARATGEYSELTAKPIFARPQLDFTKTPPKPQSDPTATSP